MTPLFITGATVFTAKGAIHTRADVVVEEGRIAAVGPDLKAPEGARVIEADGLFLTPGLIDAHTHLALPDVPERAEPHPDTPFHAARHASLTLSSGVTTVRDVGGNNHADLALSRAIRRGLVPGPRMFCSGQAIVPSGGHIWYFCAEADGPEAVRAAARRQMKAGATWIKLMISGGIANVEEHPDEMHYSREEIAAAVEAAAARGHRVAVHAYPARAIRIACEVGVATIEHAVVLDEETIDTIKRTGAAIVPTHAVYEYMAHNRSDHYPQLVDLASRVYAMKSGPLEAAIAAGVTVGVGTDSGRHYPHDAIGGEIKLLAEAGMGLEGALTAATAGNAAILGVADEIGAVAPGYRADLALFRGDPLSDAAAYADVAHVIRGGAVFDPAALKAGVPLG